MSTFVCLFKLFLWINIYHAAEYYSENTGPTLQLNHLTSFQSMSILFGFIILQYQYPICHNTDIKYTTSIIKIKRTFATDTQYTCVCILWDCCILSISLCSQIEGRENTKKCCMHNQMYNNI